MKKAGNYVTRKIAGETIVVPIRAQAAELDFVYVLNEVGASIWSQLDEGRSPAEITEAITASSTCRRRPRVTTSISFLEALRGAGVIEGQVS